jgi:gas vesicle protein GvpL/GvpF
MSTAVYLYCVVRAAKRPSTARAPSGVPGGSDPAASALGASLWMVTATVPLDVYGPSRLEPRLRDLDWVSQVAVAHEAVVEYFARPAASTVVPMKLFTMFSTVDKAVRDIASKNRAIRQAMRRIAGAEEWGVRIFRRDGRPASTSTVASPSNGTEFLRARKQVRDAVTLGRAATADAAELAFTMLRRHARDARVRESTREAGHPPVLDAAFLVPGLKRARFKAEARRQTSALARAGGELVLTGPWPAYNFITPGESR